MSKGGRVTAPTVTHRVIPARGIPARRTGTSTDSAEPEDVVDVSTSDREETVFFCVDEHKTCKIGIPPAAEGDNYHQRAIELGKLENVRHVFFNPKGEMFVVRGHELYKGPTPSGQWNDWFQLAKCIGRGNWDEVKFPFFTPGGVLYAITFAGALVRGPEPNNKHVSWIHKHATTLGSFKYYFPDAIFSDPEGIIYASWQGSLYKIIPSKSEGGSADLLKEKVGRSGWEALSVFMGCSYEGDLWCVASDGKMYSGPLPTDEEESWFERAKRMGSNFHLYDHMNFTHDKTIQKVLRLDFLVDNGKILDTAPELVAQQEYDNKDSSIPLNSTFEIDKTVTAESQFSHEHGFEIGIEAETTFTAKLLGIAESSVRIAVNASTSHTWNLTDINTIQTHYKLSFNFEVPPGKAVRQKAVVKRANIKVPYTAEVLTVFGYKTMVTGEWTATSFFNLQIRQEDM
ncbi:uncharacterized protein LOC144817780 [Lissotriton helveticus]